MGRLVTRASTNPELAFIETTEGETPCSLEVTRGQNGKYGYCAKVYFGASDDPDLMADLLAAALARIEDLDQQFREYFLDEAPDGGSAGGAAGGKPRLAEVPHE